MNGRSDRLSRRLAGARAARRLAGIAGGVLLAAGLSAAAAQDAKPSETKPAETKPAAGPGLKLELNRLEPVGDNCRVYLVVDNGRGPAINSLKVALYAFDSDGVVQKNLAIELGPVGEKRTKVRPFDLTGMACPKIGRLLLNDVLACDGGEGGREGCLERIETTSRASVPFDR